VTVASRRREIAHFSSGLFRPLFPGVHLPRCHRRGMGGALKKPLPSARHPFGMGLGDNPRAALITRGLAEMVRLGRGWAPTHDPHRPGGLGDLISPAPAAEPQFPGGSAIGPGCPPGQILAGMAMVAEGVKTSRAVYLLAARLGVEMPLVMATYRFSMKISPPRRPSKS